MTQKKLGRPRSDNPMKERLFIRVTKEVREQLDDCAKQLGTSRSEVIRRGIDMVSASLKHNKDDAV